MNIKYLKHTVVFFMALLVWSVQARESDEENAFVRDILIETERRMNREQEVAAGRAGR